MAGEQGIPLYNYSTCSLYFSTNLDNQLKETLGISFSYFSLRFFVYLWDPYWKCSYMYVILNIEA
jgi:hypothetical protein